MTLSKEDRKITVHLHETSNNENHTGWPQVTILLDTRSQMRAAKRRTFTRSAPPPPPILPKAIMAISVQERTMSCTHGGPTGQGNIARWASRDREAEFGEHGGNGVAIAGNLQLNLSSAVSCEVKYNNKNTLLHTWRWR